MPDQNLFTPPQETPPATPEAKPVQEAAPVYDHLLGTITNAQGEQKYSTVEKALEGAASGQAYIAKLEGELKQLRGDSTKGAAMEDILEAMRAKGAVADPVVTPEPVVPAEQPDIPALVAQSLGVIEQEKTEKANIAEVVTRTQEAYGDKASELFYSKAAEFGFDKVAINTLAMSNPKAVYNILGLTDKPASDVQPVGINTETFQQKPPAAPVNGMYGSNAEKQSAWDSAVTKTNIQLGIK
ncbi:MAG: hypothetical protein JKY81_02280 [Colwellia sp.]|nr:hypothetical protein [Colwellia sp.]